MKIEEILSIEKWAELEKEINTTFGFYASVFDENGIRITGFQKLNNQLCSVIQANEKGKSFICAVANRNVILQAKQIRKPVITECDAGLLKLVVPIFVGDELLGVLSGCGLLVDGSNVETFLIKITTGIDEKEITSLSNDIAKIENDKIELVVEYLEYLTRLFINSCRDQQQKLFLQITNRSE